MSFELGQATLVTDPARVAMISRAFRKTGKEVVLVPLGVDIHAGQVALLRAARAIRGAVVIAAMPTGADSPDGVRATLAEEHADVLWSYTPHDTRTQVMPEDHGLEPVESLARELTALLRLVGTAAPTHLILGEKDYELLAAVNRAVYDLALPVRVQGVPTVRMPDGLAISLRNSAVAESARSAASALSAALTAGAHAAEAGEDAVVEAARAVLAAAGVEPEYVALRGLDLGPAPEQGDARLLIAATIGGVRLIDNVGVPVGIGFRNLQAD